MTDRGPLLPESGGSPGPDPLAMPLAEKLACEWEARHDVMARGGRARGAAAIAQYRSHTRCEDVRHGHAHGSEHHAHDAAGHAAHHTWEPQDHLRSWLRWGEDTR